MKLPEYIETIAVGLKDGCLLAQGKGVNITPHLHMDLRGGKCPDLPYGNSFHLLLPVELEISLTNTGEVATEVGLWSWLNATARASRKATHRATVRFWIEVEAPKNDINTS
jgi:hypothetical protein